MYIIRKIDIVLWTLLKTNFYLSNFEFCNEKLFSLHFMYTYLIKLNFWIQRSDNLIVI